MSQIQLELDLLFHALNKPQEVYSAELVAEELVANTDLMSRYEWDFERRAAIKDFSSGFKVSIWGHEVNSQIKLDAEWEYKGLQSWQNIFRDSKQKLKSVEDMLRAAGWEIDSEISDRSFYIKASLDKQEALRELKKNVTLLDRIFEIVNRIRV